MTGEEMERAIEFLLKGQATLDGQIAETNKQLQAYAQTQSEFIDVATRIMTGLAETQERLGESQKRTDATLAEAQARIAEAQARTDASIDRLASSQARTDATVDRLASSQARTDASIDRLTAQVSAITEAQQHTDERLNALIDIVMEGRNGKP